MTTVSVYVQRVAGDEGIAIRNGFSGPATTLFHTVLRACEDGELAGDWSYSHAKVTVSGAMLKELLSGIGPLEPPYHTPEDNEHLDAFRCSIVGSAEYAITAHEV